MVEQDPWHAQLQALGTFIRTQRQLADLSLREMGDLAKISNAYLSQVERGLHQPSVRVLRSIAAALGLPADELLAQAGLTDRTDRRDGAGGSDPPGRAGPAGSSGEPPAAEPSGSAGTRRAGERAGATAAAILSDPSLSADQREALLAVYRSFLAQD